MCLWGKLNLIRLQQYYALHSDGTSIVVLLYPEISSVGNGRLSTSLLALTSLHGYVNNDTKYIIMTMNLW